MNMEGDERWLALLAAASVDSASKAKSGEPTDEITQEAPAQVLIMTSSIVYHSEQVGNLSFCSPSVQTVM